MRKLTPLLLVSAVALGGLRHFLAAEAPPLDEFAVARNAPLVIPPDYTLTPPTPEPLALAPATRKARRSKRCSAAPPRAARARPACSNAQAATAPHLGARSVAGDPGTNVVDKGPTTQAIIAAPEGDGAVASAQTPQ